MKTLLTALIIGSATLLPTTSVQAEPVGKTSEFAAKKTFGSFKAGERFSLRVKNVNIISSNGKFPPGVPKFKKGEKVNFVIGKKGELTGKGFKVKFVRATGAIHDYLNPAGPYKLNMSARVSKSSKTPSDAVLTFNLVVISGGLSNLGSYQVSYTF